MLLVAAIVLVKANRNPQALLILVPLLIVNLAWFGLKKIINLTSSDAGGFDQLLIPLTVGISVLWLLGHWLANRSRFVTFLLAFTIMAVVGLAGAISYGGLEFSQQTVGYFVILAMLIFAMLLGFVLTGWCCRKSYRPVSFMLWLAVWTVTANIVCMLVVYSIAFSVQRFPVSVYTMLFLILVTGSVLGAITYVVVFPYMILALRSSFYRQRFFACLRLKSMPVETKVEPNPPLPEV